MQPNCGRRKFGNAKLKQNQQANAGPVRFVQAFLVRQRSRIHGWRSIDMGIFCTASLFKEAIGVPSSSCFFEGYSSGVPVFSVRSEAAWLTPIYDGASPRGGTSGWHGGRGDVLFRLMEQICCFLHELTGLVMALSTVMV